MSESGSWIIEADPKDHKPKKDVVICSIQVACPAGWVVVSVLLKQRIMADQFLSYPTFLHSPRHLYFSGSENHVRREVHGFYHRSMRMACRLCG